MKYLLVFLGGAATAALGIWMSFFAGTLWSKADGIFIVLRLLARVAFAAALIGGFAWVMTAIVGMLWLFMRQAPVEEVAFWTSETFGDRELAFASGFVAAAAVIAQFVPLS